MNSFQAVLASLSGRLFPYGQRAVFIGKIKPVETLGCKIKEIGCENAIVSLPTSLPLGRNHTVKKNIALGLVASTLFLAGCCTAHHTTKWEYKEVSNLGEVNTLCKTGWSLANVNHHEGGSDTYLVKHEVQ
jgi:hypothetical protein